MNDLTRRRLLATAGAAVTLGTAAGAATAARRPPGRVWQQSYVSADLLTITDVTPAHGEGWVILGPQAIDTAGGAEYQQGLTALAVGADGATTASASFLPETEITEAVERPGEYRYVRKQDAGIARGSDGYGVAVEDVFVLLDADLTPQATHRQGNSAVGRVEIAPIDGGFVVAREQATEEEGDVTTLTGYATDGTVRWKTTLPGRVPCMLAPDDEGFVVAGNTLEETGAWIGQYTSDGDERGLSTLSDLNVSAWTGTRTVDGDALLVSRRTGTVASVTPDGGVNWQRPVDAFAGEDVNSEPGRWEPESLAVTATSDGGALFGGAALLKGGFTVAKTDGDGEQRWAHSFDAGGRAPASYVVTWIGELSAGEYLLTCAKRTGRTWTPIAVRFTDSKTPEPTATPTPTGTPTPSPTPTNFGSPDYQGPMTEASGPGFGVTATLVALAGGGVASRLLRGDTEN